MKKNKYSSRPLVGLCAFCAAILLTAAFAVRAKATTLAQLSIEQLTSAAYTIVVAQCVGNESLWRDGEIWTVSTFHVLDHWKGKSNGAAPAQIQVWMIGGSVGPVTSYVPGAPRFRAGEQAVLFLEPMRNGQLSVIAWGEGTFRIHSEARSGAIRVTQDTAGMTLVRGASGAEMLRGGIHDWPLAKLKARVLTAMHSEMRRQG